MKMRLFHPNRTPYGGVYELDSPETGMVGKGSTFHKLMDRVVDYRKANGIPIGLGFEDELVQAVCAAYPQECVEDTPKNLAKPHRLGWKDVLAGSRVSFRVLLDRIENKLGLKESPLVSREEAERRAAICAQCKQNQPIMLPCGGVCGELKKLVQSLVGNEKTSVDERLKSCFICHCYVGVAVWVDLWTQLEPLAPEVKAKFEAVPRCWKKESLLP